MPSSRHLPLAVVAVLAMLAPGAAQDPATEAPPDVVVLLGGDRLRGTVVAMRGGTLKLRTPDLGEIEIPFGHIADLRTAAPVVLRTKTGERLERAIVGLSDGQVNFAAGAEGDVPAGQLAIDNLEAINPPDKTPIEWSGSLDFGGSLSIGNTQRREGKASLDAARRSEVDRLTTRFRWRYAEERDSATKTWDVTDRRTSGSLKYDYFLSKKSYLFANTQAEGDKEADIALRYTVGGGYGYQFLETEDLSFAVDLGVNYVYEDFRTPGTMANERIAALVGYKFELQITETLRLLQDLTMYPSLEDSDDVFLTLDTRLRASLTEKMFGQLQWVFDYDNTPAPGAKRDDHYVLLSVGWTF